MYFLSLICPENDAEWAKTSKRYVLEPICMLRSNTKFLLPNGSSAIDEFFIFLILRGNDHNASIRKEPGNLAKALITRDNYPEIKIRSLLPFRDTQNRKSF